MRKNTARRPDRWLSTSDPGRRPRQSWKIPTALAFALLAVAACSRDAAQERLPGGAFLGAVAADEPRAALVARDILAQGGSAADAATALGFALAVTMPSRAGLGGGGACVMRGGKPPDPNEGGGIRIGIGAVLSKPPPLPQTEAIVFIPEPVAGKLEYGIPSLARGLAAVHAKLGKLRWEQLVVPAENLGRFGFEVTRTLARDIALSGIPVAGPDGRPLQEGSTLFQPHLAESLGQIRARGPAALQTGRLAESFAEGIGVEPSALRATPLSVQSPRDVKSGRRIAHFTPSAGGERAAALLGASLEDRRARSDDAAQRSAALSEAEAKLARIDGEGTVPATTGFVVVDRDGGAVACSLTMGRLFGALKVAAPTGIVAAPSVAPGSAVARSLTAMILSNDSSGDLIGGFAAGGDPAAAQTLVGAALPATSAEAPIFSFLSNVRGTPKPSDILDRTVPTTPSPIGTPTTSGLVNAVVCGGGLPREPGSCIAQHDPRGSGLSTIAESGPRR